MASNVVRIGEHGRLEVLRISPPEDPRRLRATVDRLRAAAGAGAVDVRSVLDDGSSVEVVLDYAGRSPTAPVAGPELSHIGAALAAHLADMHTRRIVHGAIAVDHVLVDADGAVRVCGFGHDGGSTAADDVLAIGMFLRELLDDADSSAAASAVRGVADRCCVPEASARPTMAAIAASLASFDVPRRTVAPPRPREVSRRRWHVVAAMLAIAAVILVVAWPRSSRARAAYTSPSTTTASSSTTTTKLRATRVWPPAAPHTIVADGRWSFGTENDLVVLLGDWDCDSVETPALIRRNGELFVIDAWKDDARGRYVTTIVAPVAANVEHGRGCDRIAVTTADGEVKRPELDAT